MTREIVNCDDNSARGITRKNYCQIKHTKQEIQHAKEMLLQYCPVGTEIQAIMSGYAGESRRYHFYVICIPEQENKPPYLHSLDIHLHIYRGYRLYTYGTTYGISTQGDENDIVRYLSSSLYDDDHALTVRCFV